MGTKVRINAETLIDVASPDPRDIYVSDIARVLSRIPRFNGHGYGNRRISVAEHSVNVYTIVKRTTDTWKGVVSISQTAGDRTQFARALLLAALHHDGHEYVFGDTATPVKERIGRKYITEAVRPLDEAIAEVIGIDPLLFRSQSVKNADAEIYELEREWLFNLDQQGLAASRLRKLASERVMTHKTGIFRRVPKIGLSYAEAEQAFMDAYEEACTYEC